MLLLKLKGIETMKTKLAQSILMLIMPVLVLAQTSSPRFVVEPKAPEKQVEFKFPSKPAKNENSTLKDLNNSKSLDNKRELKLDVILKSAGTNSGGGGDASEIGIDQIRSDILKWIENGGPSAFKVFPAEISLETYINRMTQVLQPHAVVIGFVTTQQENQTADPELRVYVNGQPKQCRSFISKKDRKPHILCNFDRYPKGGADQYRLIHHEFAGLVRIEKNEGASSDYVFSNQLTDFLVPEVIYRLAINPNQSEQTNPIRSHLRNQFNHAIAPKISTLLKPNGYWVCNALPAFNSELTSKYEKLFLLPTPDPKVFKFDRSASLDLAILTENSLESKESVYGNILYLRETPEGNLVGEFVASNRAAKELRDSDNYENMQLQMSTSSPNHFLLWLLSCQFQNYSKF